MSLTDIQLRLSRYPNLCRAFSDDWIRLEYSKARQRKHPLIRMLMEMDNEPSTKSIVERLEGYLMVSAKLLEQDKKSKDKLQHLKSKLKDANGFWDIYTELEWIGYLNESCPNIMIEPSYPNKGPDIKPVIVNRTMNLEVKTLNLSEYESREDRRTNEIFRRIKKIGSNFMVFIIIRKEIAFKEQNWLVREIIARLKRYTTENISKPISVYFFSHDDIQEWAGYDGFTPPKDVYINMKKYPLFFREMDAMSVVTFIPSNNKKGTPVSYSGEARKMNDDDRVNKAIRKKICQLDKTMPSIVVLDVSLSSARELDMMNALYGKLSVDFVIEKQTGKLISEGTSRDNDGVFKPKENTRISAAVMSLRRRTSDGAIVHKRVVFPNPYAKLPLTEAEINILGLPITMLKDNEVS